MIQGRRGGLQNHMRQVRFLHRAQNCLGRHCKTRNNTHMGTKPLTNLREIIEQHRANGTLRVMNAGETLKDPEAFVAKMKLVREEYQRKSADSIRVLRDVLFD